MTKYFIIAVCFCAATGGAFAQSVTSTTGNGNWSLNGRWTGTSPDVDDTAYVNHAMTIDTDIEIDDGHYRVNDGGSMLDFNGGTEYTLTVKGSGEFDISGDVTFNGEGILQNNCTLWVRSCDTLIVGGLELKNNSVMYIEACAVLIINGDLNIQNNNENYVNGYVQVNGDVEAKNNAVMSGSGSLNATGEVDIDNSATLFGSSSGCGSGCSYGSGPVLPIELASFTAEKDGRTIWVDWVTLSERDNDYFVLSRKIDNGAWEEVVQIPGAGNADRTIEYGHRDYPSTGAQIYYKLKQVDFDGRFEEFYSNVVQFNAEAGELIVFPNPSTGQITVQHGIAMEPKEISVYSLEGQLVKYLNVDGIEQDLLLSPGMYLLVVEDQFGNAQSVPVVVQ